MLLLALSLSYLNLSCVSLNLCRYLLCIHAECKIWLFGAHVAECDAQEMNELMNVCFSFCIIACKIIHFAMHMQNVKLLSSSICYLL